VKISFPNRSRRLGALFLLASGLAPLAGAEVFLLPPPGDDVIGELRTVPAGDDETLIDLARRYDFGYDEIRNANPSVDSWMLRTDTTVTLPSFYVLPMAPREGIVINVAEMRLYYFPVPKRGEPAKVETFPVSIGRGDWNTPVVTTKISGKVVDPSWTPPKSIRAEHAADGDPLPAFVPAGPDNPLGKYALRMTLPSYLIHGTNKQYGIGMQVTHGCMRLYPDDIERLYRQVPVGTTVRIINQTYKAGWHRGQLYLEIHPPLDGASLASQRDKTPMIQALTSATKNKADYPIDWQQVDVVDMERSGLPAAVGPAVNSAATAQNQTTVQNP
jgi:L,D-transpeptidase ErfK/SrfK